MTVDEQQRAEVARVAKEIVASDRELLDRLAAGPGDRIRVNFDTVQRRADGYHAMTALKFADVPGSVIVGNELIATDDAGATVRAVVADVSEEGLVDLLLTQWQPRGTGWCAPSP